MILLIIINHLCTFPKLLKKGYVQKEMVGSLLETKWALSNVRFFHNNLTYSNVSTISFRLN